MIGLLNNSEIDRTEWDACMAEADSSFLYGRSWFLDLIAPGWCAIADGGYQTVMALPSGRKYGIRYLFTPPFMQKTGLFSRNSENEPAVAELLKYLSEQYRYIDLSLASNPGNLPGRITERDNYILPLNDSYRVLRENYTSACRRNMRIAGTGRAAITTEINPQEAIALFRKGPGSRVRGIAEQDYSDLEKVMHHSIASGEGRILGFRSEEGLFYSIFYIVTGRRITLLFTSTSEESRNRKAGYVMIDYLIREFAGTGMVIDFAGSSVYGVAQFISSFGAVRAPYYRYLLNRLPWPVSLFKEG
ncbi:MAG: hypothetical protein ABR519_09415 [Bacteroidales bacterium]